MRVVVRWVTVLTATAVLSTVLRLLEVPSAALFGGLLAGIGYALIARRRPLELPKPAAAGGQIVIGIAIGTVVELATVKAIAADWAPILLVTVATLVLSLAAGWLLGRHRDVDRTTGYFAMVAGGASGLTAISRELGADDRIVAVVQYLRVLLILILMPVVVIAVFPVGSGAVTQQPGPTAGVWLDLAFTATCTVVGMLLAWLTRLPAGILLGPMLVAIVLTVTGVAYGSGVPLLLQDVGLALIGLQVGLAFTADSLRRVRRILPYALLLVLLVMVGSALLGLVMVPLADVSALDAYLATTPGGMTAVLATAAGSGGHVTFILAVQVLRLVLMLLVAPALSQWSGRLGDRRDQRADDDGGDGAGDDQQDGRSHRRAGLPWRRDRRDRQPR